MKTFMAKAESIDRKWYLVDAKDQTLGRLASQIATVLMGKSKTTFTPGVDTGDYVVVVNASLVAVTGKKRVNKLYRWHTGYIGGLKEVPFREMIDKHPDRVIVEAVKGMLPKNSLGRQMIKKMKVYGGAEHEQQAQNPVPLTFNI